jgi:restriction endonuclease S subunit
MAKTPKTETRFEETLWDSANKLRGKVESSEYKHVVLGLVFLKFASDKFEQRKEELIAEGKKQYIDMVEFYTMKNVFYLPKESRWSLLKEHAKQNDIAIKIDTALATVEKANPSLKGALPDNYYSRLDLDVSKLAALLDTINNIDTLKDKEQDIVGRVYEYFLSKFALAEGKGKGEFYTPKCIVNLIAEMIEPIVKEYHTIVNRIKLNEQLNQKLEETAQAIYKQWFVDFEFPEENGKPYKSSGGEMVDCEVGVIPREWKPGKLSDLTHVIMGQSPKGDSYNNTGNGTPLVNGPVEFGQFFTKKSKWTTEPTKLSQKEDLIVCVRGSTTGREPYS